MTCCNTFTISPGGIGVYLVDFGNKEPIFLDGLTLQGNPSISFNPNTSPPGGSTSPNFAPVLGTPNIWSGTVQPNAVGIVNPNSGIGSVTFFAGGSGWPNKPAKVWCTFSGGGGWGAVGIATVSQGQIVSVKMNNQGDGYISNPTAVFHTACVSFLVTTSEIQDGYTYQVEAYCGLSDGIQIAQGTGYLQVSW